MLFFWRVSLSTKFYFHGLFTKKECIFNCHLMRSMALNVWCRCMLNKTFSEFWDCSHSKYSYYYEFEHYWLFWNFQLNMKMKFQGRIFYDRPSSIALNMLVIVGTSLAAKFLRENGITLFKVREETVKLLGKSDMYFFSPEHPPLTEPAQKALDWAVEEKLKSGISLPSLGNPAHIKLLHVHLLFNFGHIFQILLSNFLFHSIYNPCLIWRLLDIATKTIQYLFNWWGPLDTFHRTKIWEIWCIFTMVLSKPLEQ